MRYFGKYGCWRPRSAGWLGRLVCCLHYAATHSNNSACLVFALYNLETKRDKMRGGLNATVTIWLKSQWAKKNMCVMRGRERKRTDDTHVAQEGVQGVQHAIRDREWSLSKLRCHSLWCTAGAFSLLLLVIELHLLLKLEAEETWVAHNTWQC